MFLPVNIYFSFAFDAIVYPVRTCCDQYPPTLLTYSQWHLLKFVSHMLYYRVGVVFSGRQSPGGHNVIWGLHNAIKTHNPHSVLIGFLGKHFTLIFHFFNTLSTVCSSLPAGRVSSAYVLAGIVSTMKEACD